MRPIQIAAVGDISFEGRNAEHPNPKAFAAVAPWFRKADIAIGNLENPLIDSGEPIAGKCTLHGHTGWADVLSASGIKIVSLANNHLMDYGLAGLSSTMDALKRAGIACVGAGLNESDALAPLILKIHDQKLAFIARSSVEVSSQCFAKGSQGGVAKFELDETIGTAAKAKQRVDHVFLIIHWGLEEYAYPTVKQRNDAAVLMDAGVDCILGHHPHVAQGYEKITGKPVFYSLGNFMFDDFDWPHEDAEGKKINAHITLSEKNKTGTIAILEAADKAIRIEELLITKVVDAAIAVQPDNRKEARRLRRISAMLSMPGYAAFWKMYSICKEFQLRVAKQIPLGKIVKNFYKIRPAHFKRLVVAILKSAKIVSGKTTNPYE